jgi:hypothetical protein
MKILWLSENPAEGKIPRNMSQMRTDFAWFVASDGYHTNIGNLLKLSDNSYDVAIIILPKREDILHQISAYNGFDLIGQMKRVAKKIGYMQEGPIKYFHDYSMAIQTWFFATLASMDFLMVHNDADKYYLQALIPDKNIFVNRTLIIEDAIPKKLLVDKSIRKSVMLGGNFCSWYGGFDSYMVALEFGEDIIAPSMGRMKEDELNVEGLRHIEYKTWTDWMTTLSAVKYAVHLMPTVAAGTFALNCAYLGIPCIGNNAIDTQHWCHEYSSFDLYSGIGHAKKMAKQLKENEDFYKERSDEAKRIYKEMFSEEIWVKNFFTFMEQKVFSGV